MPSSAALTGHRVIVFIQENKTTEFYFPTMKAWGADVADNGSLLKAPPNFDQPHNRDAWVHYAMGDYPALVAQIDNDTVIPFYSWLAKQFVFADHHFGLGSNSTPGHIGRRRADPNDEEPAVRRSTPDVEHPVDLQRRRGGG